MDSLPGRIAAFGRSLGPALQPVWARFVAAGGRQTDAQAETWTDVMSQPVVHLPVWLWEGLKLPLSAAQRGLVLEGAAIGYLHARLVDDLVDEGDPDPAAMMLLGRALFRRHLACFRALVPGEHPFWTEFDRLWGAAEEALLVERAPGPVDAARFEQILDGARPVLLPGLAVLAVGGRWALAGALPAVVDPLLRAHQLIEDLGDLEADAAAGRRTHVGERLGAARGAALLDGRHDAVIDEAQAALGEAIAAARELGLPVGILEERRAKVEAHRRGMWAALLGGLLDAKAVHSA